MNIEQFVAITKQYATCERCKFWNKSGTCDNEIVNDSIGVSGQEDVFRFDKDFGCIYWEKKVE